MDEDIVEAFKRGSRALVGRLINPYQRDGLLWLISRELSVEGRRGGFLCDEMGLGKTVQLIALMLSNPKPKTLIIVPVSILTQWKDEIQRFAPQLRVFVHHGSERVKDLADIPEFDVFITCYSLFRIVGATILPAQIVWDRIILDEAHEIRSPKSLTTKNCNLLRSPIKWCVTGTPIFNNLKDFVTLGEWIGLTMADTEGVRKKFLMRRTKRSVSEFNKRLELPPCEVRNIEIEMNPSERNLYTHVYNECKERIKNVLDTNMHRGMKMMILLECFLRVRQVMTHPLVYVKSRDGDYAEWKWGCVKTSYIVNAIMSHREEKTIVFCQFITEMDILQTQLEAQSVTCSRIDGSVSQVGRVKEIRKFKESREVILIQIKAGGQGINLQEATRVYITTPAWNPATELQAIARAHRTGQTQKVVVERVFYKGTDDMCSIEETIMKIQNHKNLITSKILNDPLILASLPDTLSNDMNIKTLSKLFV